MAPEGRASAGEQPSDSAVLGPLRFTAFSAQRGSSMHLSRRLWLISAQSIAMSHLISVTKVTGAKKHDRARICEVVALSFFPARRA